MTRFSRRGFMTATAAAFAAGQMPLRGFAQGSPAIALSAQSRTLDIGGRAATVYGLSGPSGQGLVLDPGQRFRVDLTNKLDVGTLIHWHGQIPPNAQDGVPDLPAPVLAPGEMRSYDFAPQPGTHWMHSHIPMQEMQLLAAPLIVRRPEDVAADRQEVVMFLHDFSFSTPEEIMATILEGHGGSHGAEAAPASGQGGMDHGSMDHGTMNHGAMTGATTATAPEAQTGMDHSAMGHGAASGAVSGGMAGTAMSGMDHAAMGHGNMDMSGMDMGGMDMSGMEMDLNDYNWDAYLANDRILSDPEVVTVERGGRIRLRVINGAAATVFFIETGRAPARLVAVDGHEIVPVSGTRFGVAMGQRLDLEIDLPAETGAWPILALREGAREQTGIILANPGAQVAKIDLLAETEAPAFDIDLKQEAGLAAAAPLAARAVQRAQMIMLGGSMSPYRWTIDGAVWGEHHPVPAITGERVELTFHNMSMMGHPMHLHGHVFQVVAINNHRFAGALRDTVYVPPNAAVTVALDAGEAARWMLHCHHMPHLQTGMMTEFRIAAA